MNLNIVSKVFSKAHLSVIQNFFSLKKMGTILIITVLSVFSYSFNFPHDANLMDQIEHASAISIDETSYDFNSAGYLSAGSYKVMNNDGGGNEVVDYQVKSGDTISSIAKQFNLKTVTVLGANELGYGEIIKPGETLKILGRDGVKVKVEKGNSFESLAKKYNVSAKVIRRSNNKSDDYMLKVGDELIIPGIEYNIPRYSRSSNIYVAGRESLYVPIKKSFSNAQGGRLLRPMNGGVMTQGYHAGHLAVDLAGPFGKDIFAAESGTVKKVSLGSYGHGYGNYIILDHGDGLQTLYAHLSSVHVKVGDTVLRGQLIAQEGSTGRSTGPHVHFEVRYKGQKQNPLAWF